MIDLFTNQTDFLAFCQRKNLSEHTLRAYRQDFNDFQRWSKRTQQHLPLTKDGMEQWLSDMSGRGLAPTTAKRRLACLKVFCRWLEDEEHIEANPFNRFRTPIKVPKRLPKNLTPTELQSLIGKKAKGRWRHLGFKRLTLFIALELLFATGIRVGELCSIELSNLDLESGIITIKGKGNRERKVYIVDDELKGMVRHYISQRNAISTLAKTLLVTKNGAALTPNQIRQSLHKHVEDVGLERRITPHMFRHTTATQLLENGVDIRFVQKLLGHASISTTEIYTHVSDAKLRQAVNGANLRSTLK
ncbi:MAG: tyrosine-type recombinase/integrase [Rhodospirillales bacterium]|nr:tyrosine-type recombinase/integrase [Rhodospirillales bacterium]